MKHLRKIPLLIVFVLVVTILFQNVFIKDAYATNLVLTGNTEGILITPADEKLFALNNVLPGESVSSVFSIRNNDVYAFTLSVRVENLFSKTPENELDLLDFMELTASRNNLPVPGFLPSTEGVYQLGRFEPGTTADIAVDLLLSGKNITNDYQGKTAELRWIFTATSANPGLPTQPVTTPDPGGGGGGTVGPGPVIVPPQPEPPAVLIPDALTPEGAPNLNFTNEGLPLGSLETTQPNEEKSTSTEDDTITENKTPLGVGEKKMPKTGETGLLYYVTIGSIVVIMGVLFLIMPWKKRNGKM